MTAFLSLDRRGSGGVGGGDVRVELAGGVAPGHLVERDDLDPRGVARRAELLEAFAAKVAQGAHRGLEELARVELARRLGGDAAELGRLELTDPRKRCVSLRGLSQKEKKNDNWVGSRTMWWILCVYYDVRRLGRIRVWLGLD